MNPDIDIILDECIDRLTAGASVEECLRLHPDFADELQPLLEAAAQSLATAGPVATSAGKARGRQRLLQERARLDSGRSEAAVPFFQRLFAQPKLWAPIAACLLVALLTYGLVATFTGDESPSTTAIATPSPTPMPTVPTTTPSESPGSTPTASPVEPITPTPAGTPDATPVPTPDASPSPLPTPTASPTTPSPTIIASAGLLEIRVTDAPAPEISGIRMTISDIQIHKGGGGDDEAGWETVVSGSKTFELLELRGIEEVLGSQALEPGHYTQIRLNVEEVKVSYHDESGTQTAEATVPSEKVKLVGFGSFEIEPYNTTVVTLDFDAQESVQGTGKGGFHFQPTVKVIVGGLKAGPGEAETTPTPQSGPQEPEGPQEQPQNQQSGNAQQNPVAPPEPEGRGNQD